MRFLLDTNTIIGLFKNAKDGPVARNMRSFPIDDIAVPTLVLSELISGALRGAPNRLADNLLRIRSLAFHALPFDAADAETAGRIDAELKRAGTPIGPVDRLIAGQALARGLTVVTNNTREFKRVAGLSVVDWTV
jgi:tRNA(fMet)-specific endonuclease VapC